MEPGGGDCFHKRARNERRLEQQRGEHRGGRRGHLGLTSSSQSLGGTRWEQVAMFEEGPRGEDRAMLESIQLL